MSAGLSAVDFGRAQFPIRAGRLSGRVDRRAVFVLAGSVLVCAVILLASLSLGDVGVPLQEVFASLSGHGTPRSALVVLGWRMPRALFAIVLGAALGISGAIFQSLTRNPLGSPDIIGFSSGSFTGALLVILVFGGSTIQIAGGALLGGVLTAAAVSVLASKRGLQGFRLIIVGIGVSAMLGSVNTLLVIRADLDDAMRAAVWGAGSLSGLGYAQLLPVLLILAIILPLCALAAPALNQLELGDDAARALGLRVGSMRFGLLVLGVALTALVTATAGPIAFISLVAPQIARRLTGAAGAGLIGSAVIGAALLSAADLAGQRLFSPTPLPVGIMTVSIGGAYFVWLLLREARRGA